ncbi:hypothetical protein [Pontibacter beigongshangensis]|uniref:hypothetical protein n=1 Tax=Pontibacter beigongshangensis TaxID=2574733 RepID=UPI00164F6916|nr:hypothetical protein [Pontibacter beigongshangensis]
MMMIIELKQVHQKFPAHLFSAADAGNHLPIISLKNKERVLGNIKNKNIVGT